MNRQNLESHDSERPIAESNDTWSACSPGTIGQLRDHLAVKRRSRAVIRLGGSALVATLLGFVVWTVSHNATTPVPAEMNFGGVACSYVQENMQQYAMQTLEPAEQAAVAIHLEQCPVCQTMMKAMNEQKVEMAEADVSKTFGVGSQSHRAIYIAFVD